MSKNENFTADPAGSETTDEGHIPRSEGVRETFESIIVAFILAFVFRAFVVEAFVIPTGSMAPSLRGMHANHRCAKCEHAWAYGLREPYPMPNGGMSGGTLSTTYALECPNCGWDGEGNRNINSDQNRVSACAGDRILVLKWPYDIGGPVLGPQRWDVGVFKNPQDGEMNYIKRILGVPGEVLEILNGDVFAASANDLTPEILAVLDVPEPDREMTDTILATISKHLRIQRKSRIAQESLWMLHYDHDFPARSDASTNNGNFDPPRWMPMDTADAWNAETPVIRFESNDDKLHWLKLAGRPIRDNYGYNNALVPNARSAPSFAVGDVRLRFVVTPKSGDGELVLFIRKGIDRFRLTIAADGGVQLERLDTTGLPPGSEGIPRLLASARLSSPLAPRRAVQIEIENVDYRVALRVDGAEVVATDDRQYSPDAALIEQLRNASAHSEKYSEAEIRIGARSMPLELRHVQVHRDVYYTTRTHFGDPENLANGEPLWGTAGNPIHLRRDPAEFFCCGDNSPESQDSRLWLHTSRFLKQRPDYQRGTVPADQMIGRAFFVYWPSGLRFSRGTIGVIPNVGRMRYIR